MTADVTASATATGRRPLTSPAVRRLARETGVDLAAVAGSGPRGRILKADLENYLSRGPVAQSKPATRQLATGSDEIKVIGVRRVIAQRMTDSKRNIPHFAYVEELDITELESLRKHLNEKNPGVSLRERASAVRVQPTRSTRRRPRSERSSCQVRKAFSNAPSTPRRRSRRIAARS